jgi:hypothetical protein
METPTATSAVEAITAISAGVLGALLVEPPQSRLSSHLGVDS